MISLIKIRARYLSRHPCGVFCTYLFIPTMILLFLIEVRNYNNRKITDDEGFSGKIVETNVNLFKGDFSSIINYNLAFLTENIIDCNIIKYILGKSITCKTDESEIIDNDKVIVKIINKDNKYNIQLQQNTKNQIFSSDEFVTNNFIDLFKYPEIRSSYHNYNSFNYFYRKYYHIFLNFQEFFSEFLIQKYGHNLENKDLFMNIGINGYPPKSDYYSSNALIGPCVIFTIIICLQLSMTTYFFNMRMIDEKEKKLTILLERQGVSRNSYFYSWLLSYLILSIIPLIAFILFYVLYIPIHIFLFFINLLFFICSLFSSAYFFYSCISTTKTASIVIKFINFTTAVLGAPIAFPQCPKITKIILAFIPQINVYLCSNSIEKLGRFADLSWEKLWLKAYNFSYMESIIMYLVDILFYSLLSKFIYVYKNSGLSFFQFIKSFFTKVSRKINQEQNVNENENNIEFQKHFQE